MKLTTIPKVSKWLTILSLGLIILGVVLTIRGHFIPSRAVPATGTIIELIEHKCGDGSIYYVPVLSFEDAQGNTHQMRSSSLSFFPSKAKIGDKAALLYDPENFSDARQDSLLSLVGVIFIICGILNFILFLVVIFITQRVVPGRVKMGHSGAGQNGPLFQ